MNSLTKSDLELLQDKGIPLAVLETQIQSFVQGFPYAQLIDAATKGKGLLCFSPEEQAYFEDSYFSKVKNLNVLKFVPASGAATRMFKHLFEYKDELINYYQSSMIEGSPNPLLFLLNDKKSYQIKRDMSHIPDPIPAPSALVEEFFENLKSFAFYPALKKVMAKEGFDVEECLESGNYLAIMYYVLEPKGLNYANLPKGLLEFHFYADKSRTALEEHLVEAAAYAQTFSENKVYIHFTVSPEHLALFKRKLEDVLPFYQAKFGISYAISYSIQKPSTDTVAVDLENNIFRDEKGEIVFRPAGHGALIENLNDLDADLIFIKNIDNVTIDSLKADTAKFKKILGSILLEYKAKIDDYLRKIDGFVSTTASRVPADLIAEIEQFATQVLQIKLKDSSVESLYKALNRPIRVCGMVQNIGEPGGGPFWVLDGQGETSLQIVESSQINLSDSNQNTIFKSATHFNPVDLVCSIKDYKNEKFDLKQFVDPLTSFISEKSVSGKKIKALELPGLWNGAMAHWITLFVEVPMTVFSPVKTVNDLLRKEHRG